MISLKKSWLYWHFSETSCSPSILLSHWCWQVLLLQTNLSDGTKQEPCTCQNHSSPSKSQKIPKHTNKNIPKRIKALERCLRNRASAWWWDNFKKNCHVHDLTIPVGCFRLAQVAYKMMELDLLMAFRTVFVVSNFPTHLWDNTHGWRLKKRYHASCHVLVVKKNSLHVGQILMTPQIWSPF